MVLDMNFVQYIWKGLEAITRTVLTLDNIFYIGVGLTLLMVLFYSIKSTFAYECKLERATNRMNDWLIKHQILNENNLLEFNMLMKSRKTPNILRKHWQQYMLYRDKLPSEYMSAYNCIDKPEKTSSFTSNIKSFGIIYWTIAVISWLLSLITFSGKTELLTYLSMSLITPVCVILIGLIFTLSLRAIQNNNLANLYHTFHIFNRYIDKASVGIPKYVDFEVLFTKKEIKRGIPILGEYLEKRARQEQEELEEAQKNAVSHEEYDFSASGVDGSLVLERAMKESATYLNFKERTLAEIQQFESEISTLKKNYENTSKDYQRKLQTSKENMERLRQQQEESTNRIEVNYIRKQQQDEVKKQEQLEKDQEDSTNKFNAEVNSLTQEIEKRRIELDSKKQKVQEAMENEYQSFSAKLHKTISTDIEKISNDQIQKIANEKEQYAQAITYLKSEVDSKEQIIQAKEQIIAELANRIARYESGEQTYNPTEQLEDQYSVETEAKETDLGQQPEPESYEYAPTTVEETQALQEQSEEYTQEIEEQPEVVETPQDEPVDETATQEDGHYDDRGYYWFADKTYYDADGLFHDLEGNVYDENGTLLATNQVVEQENTEETANDNLNVVQETADEPTESNTLDLNETSQEDALPEENKVEQTDGHYDDNGYYWFNDKTYYDEKGLFHDLDGNVFDGDGNLVSQNQPVESEPNAPQTPTVDTIKENVEQPKRKVGRPRKEVSAEEENKPKRSVGRPRKEPTQVVEEQPKRSVGRPKKQISAEEQAQPKRSVGRPRKEPTQAVEEQPKRKVGRPKKETSSEEELKPKRSVGRPRKEPTQVVEEQPKRSVGRPKKQVSAEEQAKPKRSVGRPKKSESTNMDILKQLGQSLIEVSEKKTAKRSAKKN